MQYFLLQYSNFYYENQWGKQELQKNYKINKQIKINTVNAKK